MTVAEAIREAAQRLAATSDTARLDAEILMAHALSVSRSDMLIYEAGNAAPSTFALLIERRAAHEPVAYIVGSQEFYGLDLAVAPGVLIPRGDSETLIEAAIEAFADRGAPAHITDLGTGSGALILAALRVFPGAEGQAIDASEEVADIFQRNAERHAAGRAVHFSIANWHDAGWSDALEPSDLVLCNPPYVEDGACLDAQVAEFEPSKALFAGPDGLSDYRVLLPQLRRVMNPSGVAILEIGASQADAVSQIARLEGFDLEIRNDLANRPRCVVLR